MADEHRKKGRPKKETEALVLRVDLGLIDDLDELAKIKGISRNRLCSIIISDYVRFYLKTNK